ncbi:hypothetical protein A1OQ_18070 [Enterovibrio norvegicus FF-162]|uniref:hypothetical protein n=1 Tax=Enterovibrio norvegicus TaxID=188144 RepID=UPI0002D61ABA|nr:hypothetical protein [Enterovibrio norvegicus]OEE85338.1 hypothetical protein A1OQ_18070 [Enterovibrio norvegicus FF-162]
MAFDLARLIKECESAFEKPNPQKHIVDILTESLRNPTSVAAVLQPARRAGYETLYVSDAFTILHFVWAPKMTMPAHNHNLWAVVGVYEGREDHIFWRRNDEQAASEICAVGAATLAPGEVLSMDTNAIHSVLNPTDLFTGGIHIYSGNFFETPRSGWDPMSLQESPLDAQKNNAIFEAENALLDLLPGSRASRS